MTSLVLFDLGDVLARYDLAPRLAQYAERAQLEPPEVVRRLWQAGFSLNCDRGHYSREQMHAEICARLGVDFTRDELLRLEAAAFRVDSAVLALAAEVAERARIGVLSNNSPLLEEAFPRHFAELCERFDPILFSYRFGHVKPDPKLFELVSAEVGVPTREILFIDDQEGHVAAARRAGWDAIQFASEGALRRDLSRLGLAGARHS